MDSQKGRPVDLRQEDLRVFLVLALPVFAVTIGIAILIVGVMFGWR